MSSSRSSPTQSRTLTSAPLIKVSGDPRIFTPGENVAFEGAREQGIRFPQFRPAIRVVSSGSAKSMMLPDIPNHFEGYLSEFVERYVVPALPPPERLLAWTEALLEYYARTQPICLVRGPRKGELLDRGGERVVDTDNAPAIWCYLRAQDGSFDPGRLGAALDGGEVPVLAMVVGEDRRSWSWNYAPRPLPKRDSTALWDRRLKHCHLLGVAGADGITPRQRALRNLCPLNHFLFPNGNKHFTTTRLGWNESPGPSDLGESPRVVGWIAWQIREILGRSGAVTLERFVTTAGGVPVRSCPPDARIRVVSRTSSDEPSKDVPPVARLSRSTDHLTVAATGVVRKWTMNSNLDYYVRNGETEPVLRLHLSYRRRDGVVEPVGSFLLDLPSLVERGLCTRRGTVFDVKLGRSGGRYWLGVRTADRAALSDFEL